MVIFPPAGGCHLLSFAFGVIMLRGIYGHFSASIHGQFLFPLRHKEHKELESRLPAVLFMVIYPPVGGCHLLSFAFGVIMLRFHLWSFLRQHSWPISFPTKTQRTQRIKK